MLKSKSAPRKREHAKELNNLFKCSSCKNNINVPYAFLCQHIVCEECAYKAREQLVCPKCSSGLHTPDTHCTAYGRALYRASPERFKEIRADLTPSMAYTWACCGGKLAHASAKVPRADTNQRPRQDAQPAPESICCRTCAFPFRAAWWLLCVLFRIVVELLGLALFSVLFLMLLGLATGAHLMTPHQSDTFMAQNQLEIVTAFVIAFILLRALGPKLWHYTVSRAKKHSTQAKTRPPPKRPETRREIVQPGDDTSPGQTND